MTKTIAVVKISLDCGDCGLPILEDHTESIDQVQELTCPMQHVNFIRRVYIVEKDKPKEDES